MPTIYSISKDVISYTFPIFDGAKACIYLAVFSPHHFHWHGELKSFSNIYSIMF